MQTEKILIADDSISIRQYLKEVLKPLNVDVVEAEDGNRAFQLIKEIEFKMILMDIAMPGQSGIEATHRVREELGYKYTPIIMITGLQQPELIKEAFDNGATDYITKPLNEIEVISRVNLRIEKRQLERDLIDARKIADHANQAKSEFLSRLAHELKTPLNAISGFTDLINLDAQDANCKKRCAYISDAVDHQVSLIDEVTQLAKIEAGIIDIDLTDVELTKIIKETFNLITPMAEKLNIKLSFPRRADAMYRVKADYKRLKEIFLNLLSNAIKYNKPDGEVNLLIEFLSDNILKIGVHDTGPGIAENDLANLFEVFNRLGAEKTDIEGTGIGLPITKKLIELMDGKLSVESTVGEGTTFWIELDAQKI